MKHIRLIIGLPIALAVSLFAGIMIGTAGGAVYTPLYRAAAPFICADGDFRIESQNYSYRTGETGVTHTIYCRDERTGADEEMTLRAVFVATLVYSALALPFFGLLTWGVFRMFPRTPSSFSQTFQTHGWDATNRASGGQSATMDASRVFVYNGRAYANPEDMPEEARAAYDKASGLFADSDGDGVPDLFEKFVGAASVRSSEEDDERPERKSATERLAELKRMKEAGLIAEQEYESKRAQILSEL